MPSTIDFSVSDAKLDALLLLREKNERMQPITVTKTTTSANPEPKKTQTASCAAAASAQSKKSANTAASSRTGPSDPPPHAQLLLLLLRIVLLRATASDRNHLPSSSQKTRAAFKIGARGTSPWTASSLWPKPNGSGISRTTSTRHSKNSERNNNNNHNHHHHHNQNNTRLFFFVSQPSQRFKIRFPRARSSGRTTSKGANCSRSRISGVGPPVFLWRSQTQAHHPQRPLLSGHNRAWHRVAAGIQRARLAQPRKAQRHRSSQTGQGARHIRRATLDMGAHPQEMHALPQAQGRAPHRQAERRPLRLPGARGCLRMTPSDGAPLPGTASAFWATTTPSSRPTRRMSAGASLARTPSRRWAGTNRKVE